MTEYLLPVSAVSRLAELWPGLAFQLGHVHFDHDERWGRISLNKKHPVGSCIACIAA